MIKRSDMLEVGPDLYVVKRKFRAEQFQKVIDHFGAKTVIQNYHCESILRSRDGWFYLVDKVDDVQIV